jgi:hypothetical protein
VADTRQEAIWDTLTSALDGPGLNVPAWRVTMVLSEAEWLGTTGIAGRPNIKFATMTTIIERR